MRLAHVLRYIGLSFLGSLTAWYLCSYLFEGPASLTFQSLLHVLSGAVAALVLLLFIPKRRRASKPEPRYRGD